MSIFRGQLTINQKQYLNKMKTILSLFFIVSSFSIFSQTNCHNDILSGEKMYEENKKNVFLASDFSDLWNKTDNYNVLGVLGDDFQRIKVRVITVVKNTNNPEEYFVYGKSNVKGNVCDFIGKIIVEKIHETKREQFGVDNQAKDTGIKTQGLLIAKYEFFENRNQSHTGVFTGQLRTKWYINKDNQVKYDDINLLSDGYFNNAFEGTWTMYNTKKSKICKWADYRVPNIACDFDLGAGEFSPNEKYFDKGWLSYAKAFLSNDEQYKNEEFAEWWR